ncbi:NADH-quinone oxidoreductase subunit K [Helicobacter ailurogastricus]|uniref:NADH-quinone oxidoreductase subunit K n=1 Tax=Helicobacter ailurogastricus TaxID=1578720 RepID=A0A0K2Y8Z8_9HELI|nr:NADH-quinone oxidoreductase subunit NuoK [Helicobacter ailurogastricus]BDQ28792.1 NADH-quinone oxidoreductase subunit K [Helicobacter ailurogastricus]GMB90320.1 NADH-quinone oxidoreductase subunit K [Helicobacter ailurogastricus]GMB91331.1 NADH-quinone oxidoreductase subunit K [Helicobacter ailurogastricus]CRI32320.1 NADH-ubiquinone oxidoreductase chain K [Helicobacter ailurogastricus]
MVSLAHYLVFACLLFSIGLFGMLRRKNILMLFFSTEIMLNAINVAFVAIAHSLKNIDGQIFALFMIGVAASEVAVGLGLVILWQRKHKSLDIDTLARMRG